MNTLTKTCVQLLAWAGVFTLVSFVKINILFGAKTAVISGFAVAGPLSFLYAGIGIGAAALLLRRLVSFFLFGTNLVSPFAFYLPTLAAGCYFNSRSWLVRLVLPVMCMVLFMLHPIGAQAWFYSLYWLVPVTLFFIPSRLQFAEALGVTFVQHAVGSVVWLYCMPTTAAVWAALMPIVFVERLLCATGMVIVMQTVELYTYAVRGIKKATRKGVVW